MPHSDYDFALLQSTPPFPPLPTMIEGSEEAARTIASVESHLRHLQLQHAEAQQRMNELTKQAQVRHRAVVLYVVKL